MKLTNIGLVFSIILLCFMVIDDIKTKEIAVMASMQIKYNNTLDNAAQDAMIELVEHDSGREKVVNKEEAVNRFFTSLAINFGIMDHPTKKKELKLYVPVIGIILEDGFFIYYGAEKKVKESILLEGKFSEKISFLGQWEGYHINYTLTDYVYIYNEKTGMELEGDFHDIYSICPLSLFENEILFDRERRKTIIQILTDEISYYMIEHNRLAKQLGINYEFALPTIEEEDWYRTIDDISLIAFFQGYPYGNSLTGYYNKVAISGARVRKVEEY